MVRHICDRCGGRLEHDGTERYMSGKYSYIALRGADKRKPEERLALCGKCFEELMAWLKNMKGKNENGQIFL